MTRDRDALNYPLCHPKYLVDLNPRNYLSARGSRSRFGISLVMREIAPYQSTRPRHGSYPEMFFSLLYNIALGGKYGQSRRT